MTSIAWGVRTVAGWLVGPLMALGPTAGLVALSVLTGVGVMIAFKYTANPHALRRAKNGIGAALLGIVVFRHDTRVMFGEEWRLLRSAVEYLIAGVRPLAVVIVPMAAIFAQIELYAGFAPLPAGGEALVVARAPGGELGALAEARLSGNAVEVVTPALRIPATGEVCWRIRADTPGTHTLTLSVGGATVEKTVAVGGTEGARRLSPHRARGFFATLFGSAEPPIEPEAPVASISVEYPPALVALGPLRLHWIWATLIIATIAALVVKPILRVEL